MTAKEIGKIGENAACRYLEGKGCKILKRNFYMSHYEVDILAEDKDCVVFIEVKTRKNSQYGYPADFVDTGKRERMKSVAMQYCKWDCDIRFDIIEVMYETVYGEIEITEVNHIENAF